MRRGSTHFSETFCPDLEPGGLGRLAERLDVASLLHSRRPSLTEIRLSTRHGQLVLFRNDIRHPFHREFSDHDAVGGV